jgi:hypothetical protein
VLGLQASLLGHILFSLYYYYYLHHICESDEGKIFMFADDTTIYTIDKSPRLISILVCTALYNVQRKLYKWCCDNHLTPHPRKSEFIIFSRSNFVKPLRIGVKIENKRKWKNHVNELIMLLVQKLNFLEIPIFPHSCG